MLPRASDERRIQELLTHLEALEARRPKPEETSIVAVARQAIIDEISRLSRTRGGLSIRRRGDNLEAISMVS